MSINIPYSEYTKVKNEIFNKMIREYISIVEAIFIKHGTWLNSIYWHFDINAGTGKDKKGNNGSVLQFCEAIESHKIKYHLVCIEKDKNNYNELLINLKPYQNKGNIIETHPGDHKDILPKYFTDIKEKRYGTLYSDPPGSVPPFELLEKMSKCDCYKTLDFIINFAATTIKRVRKCSNMNAGKSLEMYKNKINKKHWLIRKQIGGKHQWCFLFATNWDNVRARKKLGFVNLDSLDGQKIWREVNLTIDEKKKIEQQMLPFTETIQSTCNIQNTLQLKRIGL